MSNSYPRAGLGPSPSRLLVLAGVAATLFSRTASAEPRVDVSGAACRETAIDMERRLLPVLDGLTASGLAASVTFEPDPAGIRVTVTTREHSATRGETALVVSSCEEALDAAVLVLSLAFGVQDSTRESAGATPPPRSDAPVQVQNPAPSNADVRFATDVRRHEPEEESHRSAKAASRLSLAGGLDVGTLPIASAFVTGGITRSWSAIEVRGSLHYGLPSEHERVETHLRESVQRDFGAIGLAVCYGMGAGFRVAACLGSQVGVVRVTRRLELQGATALDEDDLAPRVTGTFGAVIGTQRGPIRPEVELSGSALVVGRRQGASFAAFRAAAGAAVDF